MFEDAIQSPKRPTIPARRDGRGAVWEISVGMTGEDLDAKESVVKTRFKTCLPALLSICLISSITAPAALAQPQTKPVFHKEPLQAGQC